MGSKALKSIKFPGLSDTYVINAVGVHHYTARWDKATASLTRLNDAEGITTTVTNFKHSGSVNANYSNPFDNIYPWAGRKLCNIDIDVYYGLSSGDSIRKAVKAWEGDPDFSYDDADGVWVYTPEFWGKSWDDGTYRYFDVTDAPLGGYVHYEEDIMGRWHGRSVSRQIDGTEKTVLIPSVGMPAKRIAMSTMHGYAKNAKMTVDDIFTLDGNILLAIVEFASMNLQSAIGSGVSSLYRQSSDTIQEAATASTVVKVLKANAGTVIPGAIFDIGTSNGGVEVGSYIVVSTATDASDSTLLDVTLNEAVTVTTAHFWSVHGLSNVADADIGSKSGYIGPDGQSNVYYRGAVIYGNLWFYILGAYRDSSNKVWLAHDRAEADAADALNTGVHIDTGITLATTGGYIQTLAQLSRSDLISIAPICTAVGGSASAPVGDYHYINATAGNTILLCGGHATNGTHDGPLCGYWNTAASYAYWNISARPHLKSP